MNFKLDLCNTAREHIINIGCKPMLRVHKAVVKDYGGHIPKYVYDAHADVIDFNIGDNAIRDIFYFDSELLFSTTFNKVEEQLLIPSVAIVSVYNKDDPKMGIGFDIMFDIRLQEERYRAMATSTWEIIDKFKQK